MHEFLVWAPPAQRVDLVLTDRRLPMEHAGGGWWTRAVEEAGAGTRYAFSLDGGPARPDPRSRSQPDGIDAPSETQGVSLMPLAEGKPLDLLAFSETWYPRYHYGWSELRAVSDGRYKFIAAPRRELELAASVSQAGRDAPRCAHTLGSLQLSEHWRARAQRLSTYPQESTK